MTLITESVQYVLTSLAGVNSAGIFTAFCYVIGYKYDFCCFPHSRNHICNQ